jgi:hypothetical protein
MKIFYSIPLFNGLQERPFDPFFLVMIRSDRATITISLQCPHSSQYIRSALNARIRRVQERKDQRLVPDKFAELGPTCEGFELFS